MVLIRVLYCECPHSNTMEDVRSTGQDRQVLYHNFRYLYYFLSTIIKK